jgi:hypothetical protein
MSPFLPLTISQLMGPGFLFMMKHPIAGTLMILRNQIVMNAALKNIFFELPCTFGPSKIALGTSPSIGHRCAHARCHLKPLYLRMSYFSNHSNFAIRGE